MDGGQSSMIAAIHAEFDIFSPKICLSEEIIILIYLILYCFHHMIDMNLLHSAES